MENSKLLYHYTSQKGLLGILNTNSLWMTNILYLNDSSEFTHTINMVKSELTERRKLLQNKGKLYDKYKEVERVLAGFLSERRTESYVFSLSTEGDDLNQWRGYCPKEGGFSIGFNHEKLLSIIENLNKIENGKRYKIRECIYIQEEQIKKVKSLIDRIDDKVFYEELVKISSYIKDKSFKDEKEYRLIYHREPKEIKYREGKSMIIPYIEFPPIDGGLLPISKIIVGPPHPELSKLSIEYLLNTKKYEDIEVVKSEIPYRS